MNRQPKQDTVAFKVTVQNVTRGGLVVEVPTFRRCGIEFGREPKIIERASLRPEQVVELLNTATLHVEEIAQ